MEFSFSDWRATFDSSRSIASNKCSVSITLLLNKRASRKLIFRMRDASAPITMASGLVTETEPNSCSARWASIVALRRPRLQGEVMNDFDGFSFSVLQQSQKKVTRSYRIIM